MILILLLLVQATVSFSQELPLELLLEWNQIDFNFPSLTIKNYAIQQKDFVQKNVFPIDVDVDYFGSLAQSRVFITTPRFSGGVPSVLGYIRSPSPTNKVITPYPDYSWHSSQGKNCSQMTSVLRVWIDECRQMWVLDTGKIGDVQMCPPQLLVFDLRTDCLILRYKFPSTQYTSASLFITPLVDVSDPGTCKKVKVYIADVTGFALIVYDSWYGESWRIQHKSFYPNPSFGKLTIAGESFDLMDGLFSLALMKPNSQQSERYLYYHTLASSYENAVPLSIISNKNNWVNNPNAMPNSFVQIGTRGAAPLGQTPIEAMDRNGNLWFVMLKPLALVCWDSSTTYSLANFRVVVQNDMTLQFASGLKVVKNLSGLEEVWIMTNRFQKIAKETLNPAEVNFRVQVKTISKLLKGNTKCYGTKLV